jgi:hypothetical protein
MLANRERRAPQTIGGQAVLATIGCAVAARPSFAGGAAEAIVCSESVQAESVVWISSRGGVESRAGTREWPSRCFAYGNWPAYIKGKQCTSLHRVRQASHDAGLARLYIPHFDCFHLRLHLHLHLHYIDLLPGLAWHNAAP